MSTTRSEIAGDEHAREFVDTVLIARPRHELFAFWRSFGNLPKFMEKVTQVTEVDALSSIWTVSGTGGASTDWEFIVTDEEADRLIAWASSGNTPVKFTGRVEFKDAEPAAAAAPGPVTAVTATLRYEPSGIIDTLVAKVTGTPAPDDLAVQGRGDLLRFKELMERAAG